MSIWLELVLQSIALGVALAMDAFSVSMANGLNDPGMEKKKMCVIAGTFAGFQFAMPMIGWFCVTTIKEIFAMFEKFIPWIALILLLFIGGKMIYESFHSDNEGDNGTDKPPKIKELIILAFATSIDALAVGVTFAFLGYNISMATCSVSIIGVVTFIISLIGVYIGNFFGAKYKNKAEFVGGLILVLIGLKIFKVR